MAEVKIKWCNARRKTKAILPGKIKNKKLIGKNQFIDEGTRESLRTVQGNCRRIKVFLLLLFLRDKLKELKLRNEAKRQRQQANKQRRDQEKEPTQPSPSTQKQQRKATYHRQLKIKSPKEDGKTKAIQK